MGCGRWMAPVEPWNLASPKENTPPSDATRQAPSPLGVAAIPTTGALSANGAIAAELIGVALATTFHAGTTVAAAASVRIATLMRGIQLGAFPRCRTIALPLAGAPKLGSDHQRIGTDRR